MVQISANTCLRKQYRNRLIKLQVRQHIPYACQLTANRSEVTLLYIKLTDAGNTTISYIWVWPGRQNLKLTWHIPGTMIGVTCGPVVYILYVTMRLDSLLSLTMGSIE